ncbi:MAG TPA: methyltransferase [Croceibacterium sp.]|nr:methyltransferase [Croceibacterium sp.]
MRRLTTVASLIMLAVAVPATAQNAAPGKEIVAAVADGARPAADTARDALRKPAEIVAFAGVRPGDKVAEIAPGGGYYTRILAKAVGPQGKVYALMPAFFASRPGGLDAINALAKEYGNIEVVVVDYAETRLSEPVDLVWTTENYHDLANGDIDTVNMWVFDALKPGGIYFVEDHSAPGTGTSATNTLHRIDPAAVIQQVSSSGFALDAESDLLHNPDDTHDVNPREAKPTSDKFALRFRKTG